jgi:hypothetical protein
MRTKIYLITNSLRGRQVFLFPELPYKCKNYGLFVKRSAVRSWTGNAAMWRFCHWIAKL